MPLTAMLVLLHQDCRYGVCSKELGTASEGRLGIAARKTRSFQAYHFLRNGNRAVKSSPTSNNPFKMAILRVHEKIIHSRGFRAKKRRPRIGAPDNLAGRCFRLLSLVVSLRRPWIDGEC